MSVLWIQDNSRNWFTPGGDPIWICGNCGKGRHVYGIENIDEPKYECPDCKSKMRYPWEKGKK